MKRAAFLLPSFLMVVICVFAQQRLTIDVKVSDDPTGRYPTSKLYITSVANDSDQPRSFEVFQMPGGFVGSGTFFNCSVQEWESQKHKWVTFRRTRTEEYPASTLSKVELKPGEVKEVCRSMLPQEGARDGACVRFTVRTSITRAGTTYVSAPFRVGTRPDKTDCHRVEK